ncbi:RluA family pseudouridine synthase [Legionella londiniensis]|uniref:Pseudouridine synthase n=1 Tax=Legionella londiniensis TaxID=45068 RepID=A0A0W0VR83_9GAMM|nr:RluA family pseudouridine synthase [Legionella londiniensis]KTD22640.1 ribosomal large subunit pseudouridine synthase [Legionella londiniensis]STX92570.1 ribosomal large subunit pseudouridine synthase [Legionella londiniensis]
MTDVRYTEISMEEAGQRLDNYLIKILKGVPKSRIYRLIRNGEVRVNKKRARPSTRLSAGDMVRIAPIRCAEEKQVNPKRATAERLLASIIYEDEYFLAINKPCGIAVHGGSGISLGVIECLRQIRTDLPYLELVHRLDKETSGCLVLAKKRSMLRALQALFESRDVKKTYWALLAQPWQGKSSLVVDAPLKKNILQSGERVVKVDQQGKSSETKFKLLENYSSSCWVEARPSTGRTHQIRVHSAYLGHPILGDEKYGDGAKIAGLGAMGKRLYLHARAVEFTLQGKSYYFQAELDERFNAAIAQLRSSGGGHD